MALALQMKKFINSEHAGDYVPIVLPGFPDKSGAATPEETKIHYLEAGVGEPLLLLHTVGQSLYTWRNAFGALSEHYRVIAVDLLGHGYSGRPAQFDYAIAEQSDALRMFMDAKGIESAHIVGFSMGAMYALDFVVKNPDRVGKVVLLSPGGVTPEMPLSVRMLQSPLFGGIACRLYNRKTVEKLLSDCFFDLTNLTEEVLDSYYATVADPYSRKAVQLSVLNFDEQEVEKALRSVSAPVLILWGGEDKWHNPNSSELYHAILENAQFSVVRNAGHLLHEEKAQRFVDAIMEYIPAPVDL
ncbi:MAG TPA: alpha/beta hydrolase [Feifaniaceae bacterium]|nr:alpha/beta hydrolase [Feifaniaceae bacterium]